MLNPELGRWWQRGKEEGRRPRVPHGSHLGRAAVAAGWELPIVPSVAGESIAQQPSGPSQESIAGLCRDNF